MNPRLLAAGRRLHRGFRLLQRRNRFVGSAMGMKMSLLDVFVLIELSADSSMSAAELARLFRLPKVSVSVSVRNLIRVGLLRSSRSKSDSRRNQLSLTALGRARLSSFDRIANQQMEGFCGAFSGEERERILSFLTRLVDALGEGPTCVRADDHPFRPTIRRLTRALRLLGQDVYGQGLSSLQWHSLCLFEEGAGPASAKVLCERLAAPPNTMSQALAKLKELGLVTVSSSQADRRIRPLAITAAGRKELAEIEETAACFLAGGLEQLSQREIERDLDLVIGFCKGEPPPRIISPEIRIERIKKSHELREARAFLVREMVRRKEEETLGEYVLAQKHCCFALLIDRRLSAVCELVQKSGRLELLHLAQSQELDGGPLLTEFIKQAKELAKQAPAQG